MKLHIECLQEKLDVAGKDLKKLKKSEAETESLRKDLQQFVDLSKKVEQDSLKIREELRDC